MVVFSLFLSFLYHLDKIHFHTPGVDFHNPKLSFPYYTAFGFALYSLRSRTILCSAEQY